MTDAWAQFQDADHSAADAWSSFQDAPVANNAHAAGEDGWHHFEDAKPDKGGVAHNFMAGVNTAMADTLGAPVDVVNWAGHHNPISMAMNAASRALGYGDVDKSEAASEARQPKEPVGGSESIKRAMGVIGANPDDVTADTTGEKLARSAGAGAAMVAAPEFAAREAPSLAASAYRAAKGVGVGAASGVGSEAAREVAPEPLKPLAALIGALGGGIVPGALGVAAKTGARSVGIMSAADVARAAANRIADSAADLNAARGSLESVPELVPGSKPTTFQATQDTGLGGLSRQMEKKYPADFEQRATEQNAARVGQLNAVQPGGDPSDLSDYLRHTMRELDEAHQQILTTAAERARASAEQLGGTGTADEYGASLRGTAQDAADRVRATERGLWQAIDPRGDLTVNASPLKQSVKDVFGGIGPSARPLSSDERAIKDAVANYGQATPFRDVADLRSWVSDAMRHELRMGGNTQSYARLARLRGAIENAITATAEMKAQQAPEELRSSLEAYGRSLGQEAIQWQTARRSGQQSIGAAQPGGARTVFGGEGAYRASGGRPDDVTGDQGILGGTPFDAEANARLKAATQATRERVDTFNRGPVGQILRKDGRQDQYRLPTSAVAAKIFHPGASAFEHVQAYRQAVGDSNAMLALQDYAVSSLRRVALRMDGTLDPAKVANWSHSHESALRAFPQLQARFQDAASASQAMTDAMAARRAALDAFDTGSLGKVMRVSDPEDVTRTVSSILNSKDRMQQLGELARATARNPNARAGLRKAIANTIQHRFVSASTGEVKASQFVKFVQDNSATLRTVFSDREVSAMRAIAADLLRTSAASPVAPASGVSLLRRLLSESAGAALGAASTLHSPFAGWLAAKALGAIRDVGMRRVDDLVRDAMLNPDLAFSLLKKGKPGWALADDMARVLRRASLGASALSAIGETKPKARRETGPPEPAASNSRTGAALDRYGISLSP